MKIKITLLLVLISIFLCSCTIISTQIDENKIPEKVDPFEKQENQDVSHSQVEMPPAVEETPLQNDITYKFVSPTDEELANIHEMLYPILEGWFEDYDSLSDNAYDRIFKHNILYNTYPFNLDEQIEKYVAPATRKRDKNCFWDELILENDPLGKFEKIPEELYDEKGKVDQFKNMPFEFYAGKDITAGYFKFSGAYIDWLVEGFWNGKVDHDIENHKFSDSTLLYYHDGYYYSRENYGGGRGGGIFYKAQIDKITPKDNNVYSLEFTAFNDIDEPSYLGKADVVMKESSNGFRFWSVLNIKFEYIK